MLLTHCKNWCLAHRSLCLPLLLSLSVLLPGLFFLVKYVSPGLDLYLAIFAMPVVFIIEQKHQRSYRHGWFSLLFALLYAWLHVQTLYFLSICFFVFFMVEMLAGTIGLIPIVMAFLIAPVLNYGIEVFSFPLRLQLSKAVGWVMALIKDDVRVSGNIVQFGEESYTVERACLGLKMVVTSFILGFSILGFHQFRKKQSIRLVEFLLFGLLLSVLVVATNFFRILLLVFLKIPPVSIAHDFVGLLALVFYVLMPLWFLAPFFIKGARFNSKQIRSPINIKYGFAIMIIIISSVSFGAQLLYSRSRISFTTFSYPKYALSGFVQSQPYDDVRKLEKDGAIVYLKPCKSYYHSTHTPTVCWRGSGFELAAERKLAINSTTILMGELRNDSTTLYTAWWYENPETKTIDQWQWRKDMLHGAPPYALVNVATTEPKQLQNLLKHMLGK